MLADRYRLVDLLSESGEGRFWRAHDKVLERHVAVHVISADDPRARGLMAAAQRSARVLDRRILRVLDADIHDGLAYVVNEWSWGASLDVMLGASGPLGPRRSAFLVAEVADSMGHAHSLGVAHGRLNPENVLVDPAGEVRIIGFACDAALHGITSEDPQGDLTDLAGLLYCALTGAWAGTSTSEVRSAPTQHGVVLRPRRVRAGVPRPLDTLCDEVLSGQHHRHRNHSFQDADSIAHYLRGFVGDPTGMNERLLATAPPPRFNPLVVLPQVPEITVKQNFSPFPGLSTDEAEPESAESAEAETPEAVEAEDAPAEEIDDSSESDELATEAGMPIFGDDDVTWLARRKTPLPPPPPFEALPERPLFAPEPSNGEPIRKPRPGMTRKGEYWPWDTGTGTAYSRISNSTTGMTPVVDDTQVPGRRTLRIAMATLVCAVLFVAITVAFNLGRGKTPLGGEPGDTDPTRRATNAATPQEITGLIASDLDPQGGTRQENPELAKYAVDDDANSVWSTETYTKQLGPTGIKTGVGLTVDLGAVRTVSSVTLSLVGEPTKVTLYVAPREPQFVADLTPVANGTITASASTLTPSNGAKGRYLVVWLTGLPEVPGGFRGEIADVVVRGS